eukprot:1342244-Pleurochrysis_carterae.AAC.1
MRDASTHASTAVTPGVRWGPFCRSLSSVAARLRDACTCLAMRARCSSPDRVGTRTHSLKRSRR